MARRCKEFLQGLRVAIFLFLSIWKGAKQSVQTTQEPAIQVGWRIRVSLDQSKDVEQISQRSQRIRPCIRNKVEHI